MASRPRPPQVTVLGAYADNTEFRIERSTLVLAIKAMGSADAERILSGVFDCHLPEARVLRRVMNEGWNTLPANSLRDGLKDRHAMAEELRAVRQAEGEVFQDVEAGAAESYRVYWQGRVEPQEYLSKADAYARLEFLRQGVAE